MTTLRSKEDFKTWIEDWFSQELIANSMEWCKISLRERAKYMFSNDYNELRTRYKWITTVFTPVFDKFVHLFKQETLIYWHNLRTTWPSMPELQQLNERAKEVRAKWRARP